MPLKYVASIIKDGKKVVQLTKADVELGTEKWRNVITLYVVGESPTIAALERFIAFQWNFYAKRNVYYHNDGFFLIWTPYFNLHAEILKTMPLWIKLPNLPLNCWSSEILSKVASDLGVPLYTDNCTTNIDRISYAHLLVEMDVIVSLPEVIQVEDSNGIQFEQIVLYDWKPEFCGVCSHVGHEFQEKRPEKQKIKAIKHVYTSRPPQQQKWQYKGLETPTDDKTQEEGWKELRGDNQNGQTGEGQNSNGSISDNNRHSPPQYMGYTLLKQEKHYGMNYQIYIMDYRSMDSYGDYNAVMHSEDRAYGNPIQDMEMGGFRNFLQNTGMTKLKYVGREFTWTNNNVYSRIDRVVINAKWVLGMPAQEIMRKPTRRPKPFRIYNYTAEDPDFQNMMEKCWGMQAKLKDTREQLKEIQANMRNIDHAPNLFDREKELKKQVEKWGNLEESIDRLQPYTTIEW
ncbi:uncharacterized protein [Nicotiana sylvestris]|uniref:uncharacterized protein n=1 Tax=Nicotiana sylvestris TaxID=4096 RepID=UPI00388CB8AC